MEKASLRFKFLWFFQVFLVKKLSLNVLELEILT